MDSKIDSTWICDKLNVDLSELEIKPLVLKPWSKVFTLNTPVGMYYLKYNPKYFVLEGMLMSYLRDKNPDFIANVIAYDNASNMLILDDSGISLTDKLNQKFDIKLLFDTVVNIARVQTSVSKSNIDFMNCRMLDTDHLCHTSARIIEHSFTQDKVDMESHIDSSLLTKAVWHAEPLYKELADIAIPDSLEHGDFHTGNLCFKDGQVKVIDFAESAWTCPLFTMVSLQYGLERRFNIRASDTVAIELRNKYLDSYAEFSGISRSRLIRAYEICERLYPIQYLVMLEQVLELNFLERKTKFSNHGMYSMLYQVFMVME